MGRKSGRLARRIDWAAVRREWDAGQLSQEQIARGHGVSSSWLREVARNQGWGQRTLAGAVRATVRRRLAEDALGPERHDKEAISDETLVAAAAMRGAAVIEAHLGISKDLRAKVEHILQLIDDWLAPGAPRKKARGDAMRRLTLGKGDSLTGLLRAAGDVLKTIQAVERKSLGLDATEGGDDNDPVDAYVPLADRIDQLDDDARRGDGGGNVVALHPGRGRQEGTRTPGHVARDGTIHPGPRQGGPPLSSKSPVPSQAASSLSDVPRETAMSDDEAFGSHPMERSMKDAGTT